MVLVGGACLLRRPIQAAALGSARFGYRLAEFNAPISLAHKFRPALDKHVCANAGHSMDVHVVLTVHNRRVSIGSRIFSRGHRLGCKTGKWQYCDYLENERSGYNV